MSGTGAIKTSGRADLRMVDCRIDNAWGNAWDEWRAANAELLRWIERRDVVRLFERRLRWRHSVWPWRRRAAVAACRELIRLRERQLGLDR